MSLKETNSNQYVELHDLLLIMQQLIDRYPDKFSEIPEGKIKCFGILNKSRKSQKARVWDMYPVPKPINDIVGIDVAIVMFFDEWSSMTDGQRSLLAADVLMTIKFKDDKLSFVTFDVQDHADMIRNFGIDYMQNPESPDITKFNHYWS